MRTLIVIAFSFLPACSGAVDSLDPMSTDPTPQVPRDMGPIEDAFCGAVQRCDAYGWIHRHAAETCGAGDAFDAVMDPKLAGELVGQIRRDPCRYYAPPALTRFQCEASADQHACMADLCPVAAIGPARCMDDLAP